MREPVASVVAGSSAMTAFLTEVMEASPAGIVVLDTSGRVAFANRSAEEILGLTRSEISVRTYNDPMWRITAIDGIHVPDEQLPFARVRATRAPVRDVRHAVQRSDGRRVLLSINAVPMLDAEGEVSGIVATVEDITQRLRAEQALSDSEERFRNVIQSLPMGVHLYRLDPDGRLVFEGANPTADHLLGVSNAEFIGKTIEEAFPPLTRTEVPDRYRQAARDGTLWHTEQVDYEDDRIRGAFEVHAFQTSPGRMAAVFQEITARLRAERALAESEERFRLMLQQSRDVIAVLDAEGIVRFMGPSGGWMSGLRPEELTGKNAFDLLHSVDVINARAAFVDLLGKPGASTRIEARMRHVAGSWVPLEIIATNLIDHRQVSGVLLNIRDVTERHRAAEERSKLEEKLRQSQKLEAIGRLAGGIAHDFNNLLTGIIGYSEVLTEAVGDDERLQRDLREVTESARRAAGLTAQLLAFSRKQVIAPKVIDVDELLDGCSRMLRRLVGEDIDLRLVAGPERHRIKADPSQVEQVLFNLVVNARDAMPRGGRIAVETSVVTVDEAAALARVEALPGDYVLLTVSDEGEGMPAETLGQVFEPFFSTKEGSGTGLGLATVHGIVHQNGGFIDVDSEVGHGTTFRIHLPSVESETEPSLPTAPLTPRGQGETILVVEDELVVRTLVERVLEREGYRVVAVANASDALAHAGVKPERFALMLTDVILPGLNGRELYERLRQRAPTLRVIYMSGYTASVIEHHGVLDENTHFLQKPFSAPGLLRKVREVLEAG